MIENSCDTALLAFFDASKIQLESQIRVQFFLDK